MLFMFTIVISLLIHALVFVVNFNGGWIGRFFGGEKRMTFFFFYIVILVWLLSLPQIRFDWPTKLEVDSGNLISISFFLSACGHWLINHKNYTESVNEWIDCCGIRQGVNRIKQRKPKQHLPKQKKYGDAQMLRSSLFHLGMFRILRWCRLPWISAAEKSSLLCSTPSLSYSY